MSITAILTVGVAAGDLEAIEVTQYQELHSQRDGVKVCDPLDAAIEDSKFYDEHPDSYVISVELVDWQSPVGTSTHRTRINRSTRFPESA